MRVLIFGTFDGLHPGHRYFIREAMKRAVAEDRYERGELFVVVARDENVRRFKGRSPRLDVEKRKKEVEKAFPRAHVLIGEVDDYFLPVLTIKPDMLALGYDQKLPPGVTEEDLREAGVQIERLGAFRPEKFKSSLLRNQRKERMHPPSPSLRLSFGRQARLRRTGKKQRNQLKSKQ